jgi:uncharacterized Fe-S cluster protein YjdI
MTRIRISHSWRTIRGAHIRVVHQRRVAVKSGSSIVRFAGKIFATEEVAQVWIDESDPEGIALEHEVIGAPA